MSIGEYNLYLLLAFFAGYIACFFTFVFIKSRIFASGE